MTAPSQGGGGPKKNQAAPSRAGSYAGAPTGAAAKGGAPTAKRKRQAPRPRRHKEVLPAGVLVAQTLASYGLSEAIRAARIEAEWDQIVGERIARRTRPSGVFRRTLQVQVQSSAWLHELGLLKNQLLDILWRALGEPRLFDDLSFQLAGKSRAPSDVPGVAPKARRPPPPPVPLPPVAPVEDQQRILSETATVEDDELRALITRVRTLHNR